MNDSLAAKLDAISAASWAKLDELCVRVAAGELTLRSAIEDAYHIGVEREARQRQLIREATDEHRDTR